MLVLDIYSLTGGYDFIIIVSCLPRVASLVLQSHVSTSWTVQLGLC